MLKAMAIGYAGKRPMHKRTPSSCDWLFQQPPSALFLWPRRSAALAEQDRLEGRRFGKRNRFRWVDFVDQEPGWRESWNSSITV